MEGDELLQLFIFWQRVFQSTPSVWRETHKDWYSQQAHHISIHSLRMAGDLCVVVLWIPQKHFNPLPPYGGRLPKSRAFVVLPRISIHSLRMEGDPFTRGHADISLYFNPLPPYGGRLLFPEITVATVVFQSTPSVWRETVKITDTNQFFIISIHSLRMEGDCRYFLDVKLLQTFQSTPSVWRET